MHSKKSPLAPDCPNTRKHLTFVRLTCVIATFLAASQGAWAASKGRFAYSDPPLTSEGFFKDLQRGDRAELRSRWLTEESIASGMATLSGGLEQQHPAALGWLNWELYGALNLESSRVWSALVECNDGNTELARVAYYQAKKLCSSRLGSQSSEEIERGLRSLHGKIMDFLSTSRIQWSYFGSESLISLANESEERNPEERRSWLERYHAQQRLNGTIQASASEFVRNHLPIHPLFSQIALEILATVARFHLGPTYVFRDGTSWIDGMPSVAFAQRVTEVVRGSRTAESDRYRTARAFANAHLIVRLFPVQGAFPIYRSEPPEAGLWQQATNTLIYFVSMQRLSYRSELTDLTAAIPALVSGVSYLNGLPRSTLPVLSDPRGSVVSEFRALALRYGIDTSREQECGEFAVPELNHHSCMAIDPSNPDEGLPKASHSSFQMGVSKGGLWWSYGNIPTSSQAPDRSP